MATKATIKRRKWRKENLERDREAERRRRKADPEKYRKYAREYYQKNKARIRERDNRWYAELSEEAKNKILRCAKEYKEEHREYYREYNHAYYKENREQIVVQLRQRRKDLRENAPEQWLARQQKRRFRYYKTKLECVEYLGGKCLKCGYDCSVYPLEFHHRNPPEKSFNISVAIRAGKTFKSVISELDKCDLLCRLCHAEITNIDAILIEPEMYARAKQQTP